MLLLLLLLLSSIVPAAGGTRRNSVGELLDFLKLFFVDPSRSRQHASDWGDVEQRQDENRRQPQTTTDALLIEVFRSLNTGIVKTVTDSVTVSPSPHLNG
jgi:hypothetical protein